MIAALEARVLAEAVKMFWLRPHHLPPLTIVVPDKAVDTDFYLSSGGSTPPATGSPARSATRWRSAWHRGGVEVGHWLATHHYVQWASVQPDSRFWAFQGIETALLCALAAALAALAFWLVRRRAV
jgi:hypothetical protein